MTATVHPLPSPCKYQRAAVRLLTQATAGHVLLHPVLAANVAAMLAEAGAMRARLAELERRPVPVAFPAERRVPVAGAWE